MKSSIQLLRIIARSHPELWELIHPHVPYVVHDSRVQFARSVQQRTRAIADAAVMAAALGHDAGRVLAEAGDELCPPPLVFPWPKRFPSPVPPGEPYPIDHADLAAAIQAEAALVFAGYAADVVDAELSRAFSDLADRLADAATAPQGELSLTRG